MSIQLDADNDRVETGTWSVSGNQITLMGWARILGTVTNDGRLIAKGTSENTNDQMWVLAANDINSSTAEGMFRIRTGSTTTILYGNATFGVGEWVHLAGVYNGSTMVLYVNGSFDASTNKSGNLIVNNDPVWFGNQPTTQNRPWGGEIADCRVYSRALSANEIETIYYAQGLDGIHDDLEVRMRGDEGPAGQSAKGPGGAVDLSENSRTLDPETTTSQYSDDELSGARKKHLGWLRFNLLNPLILNYASEGFSGTSSGSLSFSIPSTARSDSIVVVCTTGEDGNLSNLNVSGVTFGGNPLTKRSDVNAGTSFFQRVTLWTRSVSPGDSGTIQINLSGSVAEFNVYVIAVSGTTAVPDQVETTSNNSGNTSDSITTTSKSLVISMGGSGNGGNPLVPVGSPDHNFVVSEIGSSHSGTLGRIQQDVAGTESGIGFVQSGVNRMAQILASFS